MKGLGQFVMMLAVGVMATACGTSRPNPVAPTSPAATVTGVVVTTASTSSASFQLTAIARLSDGSTQDVTRSATWESSNTQLATVTSTGNVTIVGNGDVDLRATYQGVAGSVHVTVSRPRTFTLSGVVVEVAPNVRPIMGARVQIVATDHTFSDDHGVFALAGILGRTIIEVSKEGYQTWTHDMVIDHDAQLTFNLYPTPPKNTTGVSATARCNDGSWSWAQTRADACTANGGVAYAVCPGPLCTP